VVSRRGRVVGNVLLIDFNNTWNRYYFAYKNYFKCPAVEGFYKFLIKVKTSGYYSKILLVLDTDDVLHNKVKDYGQYKQNRKSRKEIYNNRGEFLKLVLALKIPVVYNNYREADDVIGYLAGNYAKGNIVHIMSSDKDFYQLLLNKNIKVVSTFNSKPVYITLDEIYDKFKNSREENYLRTLDSKLEKLLLYRAFKGDKSDNLAPPISRLSDVDLINILSYYGGEDINADTLTDLIISVPDIKLRLKMAEAFERILFNYEIMSLNCRDRLNCLAEQTKQLKTPDNIDITSILKAYNL